MNKKIIIGVFIGIVIISAILYGIYTFFTTNGFAKDGSIQDGKKELIEIIKSIEDVDERKRVIDDYLEFNMITQKEAKELY